MVSMWQYQYIMQSNYRKVCSNCIQAAVLYRVPNRDLMITKLLIKMLLIHFSCCLLHTYLNMTGMKYIAKYDRVPSNRLGIRRI